MAGRPFTVQNTSAAGHTVLSSYGTSSGRRANLSYTGDSMVRELDDPASGHHYYTYTSGRLTRYEGADGAQTNYGYDTYGLLNRVATSDGTIVTTSNLPDGRVATFTVTPIGGTAQTTSFDYTIAGQTTVTTPDGKSLVYVYDNDYRVTRVFDPSDHTAPAAVTGQVAYFDFASAETDVQWDPATDPDGADGSPASGITGYDYRYQRSDEILTDWVSTDYPGFTLTASNAGETFQVEVRARDAAGNVGPSSPVTLTATVPASTADCMAHDIGAYPSSCVDADQEDQPSLDDDPSGATLRLARRIGGHLRVTSTSLQEGYVISVVQAPDSKPSVPAGKRWTTIRNSPGKYVTGEAHDGWFMASDQAKNDVPSGGGGASDWRRGEVRAKQNDLNTAPLDGHKGCGWISLANLNPATDFDPVADCADHARLPSPASARPTGRPSRATTCRAAHGGRTASRRRRAGGAGRRADGQEPMGLADEVRTLFVSSVEPGLAAEQALGLLDNWSATPVSDARSATRPAV